MPYWYSLDSSHWVLSDEYPHTTGFHSSFIFLDHFVLATLGTSSIRVKGGFGDRAQTGNWTAAISSQRLRYLSVRSETETFVSSSRWNRWEPKPWGQPLNTCVTILSCNNSRNAAYNLYTRPFYSEETEIFPVFYRWDFIFMGSFDSHLLIKTSQHEMTLWQHICANIYFSVF